MAPDAKPGLPKLIIPTQDNGTTRDTTESTKQHSVQNDDTRKASTEVATESKEPKYSLDDATPPTFKEKLFSWRWRLAGIISLGNFVIMALRGSMAMAIVCMAGPGGQVRTNNVSIWNVSMLGDNTTRLTSQERKHEFSWDEDIRAMILSATMYSGFFMPFVGGILSQRFGAKNFILVTLLLAGVSCILIPEMTRLHVYAVIVLRFCVGLFTVGYMSALQDIWAKWAPQYEKVSLVSISIAGINLANMFSSLICGFLCTIEVDNGWPFIFYIFGSLCVLWCGLWFCTVSNSPEEHRFITEAEKQYIVDNRIGMSGKQKVKTPWKKMLTCKPVWAFILTQSCNMWCAVTLFLFLPLYFNSILGFSIEITGALLSIPFFFRFLGSLFWGILSDILLRKTSLGVTKIRKVVQATGFSMSALSSALITFVPFEYRAGTVVIIAVLLFFQSSSMASSAITPLDVAPRFAGIVTGLCLVVASSFSVIVPFVISSITFGGRREVEWRIVFCMLTGVYLLGAFVFVTFGSSDIQSWAVDSDEKDVLPAADTKDDNGIDNIVFEIETPNQDSPGIVTNNVVTRRNKTKNPGVDCIPRSPLEISVALVQPSEIGTPQMVMKFPKRLNTPRSPGANSHDWTLSKMKDTDSPRSPNGISFNLNSKSPLVNGSKPEIKQTEAANKSDADKINTLEIKTSVIPLDTDQKSENERL